MDTKVTTVIVNATKQGLTMKVGNRHCYAKLTSVKEGAEYRMQIDVNWTYQEFVLQDKSDAGKQLFINSDDCCDYERITVQELADGRLHVHTQLREQFRGHEPCSAIPEDDDSPATAHIPDQKLHLITRSWKAWLSRFL